LDSHLRQSVYCLKLKAEIELAANVEDDLEPSSICNVRQKKRTNQLDMETPETDMKEDEPVAKIGRVLGMESVRMTTFSGGEEYERSSAKANIEPVDGRQETRDSMSWLPYKRPVEDDAHPIFHQYSSSSSDEQSENRGAEVSGVDEDSEDEEDKSSQSAHEDDSNGEDILTNGVQNQWATRRKKAGLAFKEYSTYSQYHVNKLSEVEATAVKIMHKLIKKRRHWILTRL
jgi:hypothetical protein